MTSKHPNPVGTAGAASAPRLRLVRVVMAAALVFLAGFVTLLLVAWDASGSPGLADYLSEMGASAAPGAKPYRLAILCVAAAAALTASAWRLRAPHLAAAGYLALSAAMFVVSAAVPCAAGCPIPVRDGLSTLPNFVHFSVSGSAFALAIGAMVAVASGDLDARLRRLSHVAARSAIVLYAILTVLMLIFGHALANGVVERVLAITCLFWLAWAGLWLGVRAATTPPD